MLAIIARAANPIARRAVLRRQAGIGGLIIYGLLSFGAAALAQQPAAVPSADAQPVPDTADKPEAQTDEQLALTQEQVAGKYKRFEEVLLRMSELTAATDPKRAALLRKAVAQGKEQLIGIQLGRLVELLKEERLANAVTNQQAVEKDLSQILELLLSEQRGKRLKDEKDRLKEQIRRLKELINKQQEVQRQTAGGADAQGLSKSQGKLGDETGKLAKEMRDGEEGAAKKSQPDGQEKEPSGKSTEGKPAEGKQDNGKPNKDNDDAKPSDKPQDKPGEEGAEKTQDKPPEAKPGGQQPEGQKPDEQKPAGEKPGDQGNKTDKPKSDGDARGQNPGKLQDQQQGQGEAGESGAQDQNQPQEKDSARKRIEAAQQKMEQARQKLEKAQREGAVPDQEEAVRELRKAQAELEEILRQLREEELGRMLALLEARFRKMLQMQIEVYEGTRRLDRVAAEERDRDDEIESGRLSRRESLIVVEADTALSVLHDEGTAVAFPEAVQQMREDMEQVVVRLAQFKVDDNTQGREEDIIAALEEMIESLQKAQQDLEQQKGNPPPPGEPSDPPMIDTVAELKMIRSLQMRVNNRTKRYAKLVDGDVGQAEKADLLEALEQLGEREQRIFRTTRDIVVGKNQ